MKITKFKSYLDYFSHKAVFFTISFFATNILFAAELEITIDGFKNNNGQVLIALHNKSESFPSNPDKAYSNQIVFINNKTAKAHFNNIEAGVYAIAVVHDENKDGKLDKNFIGIPQEGIGASNNARASFGPPSFSEASFESNEKHHLFITLQY